MSLCAGTLADEIFGFRIPVLMQLKAGALSSVCWWQQSFPPLRELLHSRLR